MARLIITSGSDPAGTPGKTVELTPESHSIGRDASNQVPLQGESKASRRHCQLVPLKDGWEIVDLESTNGTRVNGDAVKRRTLRHGDVIEVGLTKLQFEDEKAAARDAQTKEICFLEYTAGDRKGDRVPLTAPRTTLGRRETNTIPLTDRMASGHHAEIVRDLNGYTLRDLGSTNGTLVNGELATEALLSHGSRIRIGNARFVFKDPAMAHIEVELAGLKDDDEDAGWGMMADLDVARAKSGTGGLIAALLLLVAAVGAGMWYANRPETQNAGSDLDAKNLIADGRFESTEAPAWSSEEGSPVTVKRVEKGRTGGALSVHHSGEPGAGAGMARYAEDIDISRSVAYEVSASMRREGEGRAEFAVQWIGLANAKAGAVAVTETVRVGSPKSAGSWDTVKAEVWPPGWADAARLAVVVDGGATALMDDVRMAPGHPVDEAARALKVAGGADGRVAATGGLDLQRTATVLLVGATPWARMPGGRVLGGPGAWRVSSLPAAKADGVEIVGDLADAQGATAATISWKKDADGLAVGVKAAGAEAVGLSIDLPRAHLEDGIRALGSFAPARLAAHAGEALDGARKVLAGDPKPSDANTRPPTLIAIEIGGGASDGQLRLTDADDASLVRLTFSRPGAETTLRVLSDFASERAEAQAKFTKARSLVSNSPGEAIPMLRSVAQEYPFLQDVHDQALKEADDREAKAQKDGKDLEVLLKDYAIFGSAEKLKEAEAAAAALASQFPAEGGAADALASTIRDNVLKTRAARLRFDLDAAGPEIRRITRLAQMLETEEGYASIAGTYYTSIVERYGSLEGAGSPDDEIIKRLKEARVRATALNSAVKWPK